MRDHINNSGIFTAGGTTTVSGSAIGDNAKVHLAADPSTRAAEKDRAEVGVITAKRVELNAVRKVLGLQRVPNAELPFHRGRVQVRGRDIGVVAIRAVGQGQRSAVTAFGDLRQHYSPGVIALVGIGGGIHTDTAIGDVVVGTRVVYYDLRKETAGHVQRRGDEDSAPVPIVRAVNSFFDDYGEPARFRTAGRNGVGREYRVLDGLIGTGEAVIADAGSDIRTYLRRYNDNTRAVDMEAGGLVQAFYEQSGAERVNGWVVIRGISDSADRDKNDDAQEMAAWHAATLLRDLLPYLPVADSAGAEVT